MITIIKNTLEEPKEITCPFCESVLAYTFKDIQRVEKKDPFFLNRIVLRFLICPVCKQDIDLSPKVIPNTMTAQDQEANK